jgi:hypothetical protein
MPIGNIEVLLAALYKCSFGVWRETDTTELLNFRAKSIMAGDLNAKISLFGIVKPQTSQV